jgi:alpha-ketoglutarate-dependent taurine dioxygenase
LNLLVGGDTLWASGYEAYDRLSPAFRTFLEGLTAEHDGNFFHNVAKEKGIPIQSPRGSPDNVGTDLRAVQYVPPSLQLPFIDGVFSAL